LAAAPDRAADAKPVDTSGTAASAEVPGAAAVLSSDAPKGPAVKRVRKAAAPAGDGKPEAKGE
jgi:hypothetical protein